MSQTDTSVLSTIGDWASKNKNALAAILATGGATALLGGLMTPDKKEESTSDTIKRKGGNALLAGAGGALAAGGLMYGADALADAGGDSAPVPESKVDPINGLLGTAVAAGAGAGVGAGGTAATLGGINFLRRNADSKADDILRALRKTMIPGLGGKPGLQGRGFNNLGRQVQDHVNSLARSIKVKGVAGLDDIIRTMGPANFKDFMAGKGITLPKRMPKLPIKGLKGKAGLAALLGGLGAGGAAALYNYVKS